MPEPATQQPPPIGTEFYDVASRRQMVLVDDDKPFGGWICWKHPDGQWATLRKATDDDRAKINKEKARAASCSAELYVYF